MNEDQNDIDEAAARWHVAQNDDAMDWAAFTLWLEADPRHRAALDAIALLDDQIDALLPTLRRIASSDDIAEKPLDRRNPLRWALPGGALAVAALGFVLLPATPKSPPASYAAAAGQVRDVVLADGSTATIAPGSVLSTGATRDAPMMLTGNAIFAVRHDPEHSLTIRAGGYEIRDVGTRFDVSVSGGMLRVAVSEGRVAVRSLSADGEVEVKAGQVLTSLDPTLPPALARVRVGPPSGWRAGRLVYDDVPLGLVVADIERSTGKPVTIDPSIARRRFSGILATGSGDEMAAALSELAGLSKRTEKDAIRLGDSAGR